MVLRAASASTSPIVSGVPSAACFAWSAEISSSTSADVLARVASFTAFRCCAGSASKGFHQVVLSCSPSAAFALAMCSSRQAMSFSSGVLASA